MVHLISKFVLIGVTNLSTSDAKGPALRGFQIASPGNQHQISWNPHCNLVNSHQTHHNISAKTGLMPINSPWTSKIQWEFQDPKMELLYHIRPYFVGIFPYIGLKNRPYMVGTSNKSVPEMALDKSPSQKIGNSENPHGKLPRPSKLTASFPYDLPPIKSPLPIFFREITIYSIPFGSLTVAIEHGL